MLMLRGISRVLGVSAEATMGMREYRSLTGPATSPTLQREGQKFIKASSSKSKHGIYQLKENPKQGKSSRQRPLGLHSSKLKHADRFKSRDENAWTTSIRLRRWMDKHEGPLGNTETEEVTRIVTESPNYMLNAPVWNMLIGYMGRLKKLDLMWSLYNQMKKRQFAPTARTYSTILNAYSGIAHSGQNPSFTFAEPSARTLSRATIVYRQSQEYMKQASEYAKDISPQQFDDLGVSRPGVKLEQEKIALTNRSDIESEIDIYPTNAYLKFLSRHGKWSKMQDVFLSLDKNGPLSPDVVTYTTMFSTLYHIDRFAEKTSGETAQTLQIGPTARGLWDQCVRQFARGNDKNRRIDNELVSQYIRCILRGRPEDQQHALYVIEQIWALPAPNVAHPAKPVHLSPPLLKPGSVALSKLPINVKSATTLIASLYAANLSTWAEHYTRLILTNTSLSSELDRGFLKTATIALSGSGGKT
ncbi:hypothetical protein L204_100986 [Cryptococcus depauperatus]